MPTSSSTIWATSVSKGWFRRLASSPASSSTKRVRSAHPLSSAACACWARNMVSSSASHILAHLLDAPGGEGRFIVNFVICFCVGLYLGTQFRIGNSLMEDAAQHAQERQANRLKLLN